MDFPTTSPKQKLLPKSSSKPPRKDRIYKAAWKQPSKSPTNPFQKSPQDASNTAFKLPQANFFLSKLPLSYPLQ